jgi:hypothetical protein
LKRWKYRRNCAAYRHKSTGGQQIKGDLRL